MYDKRPIVNRALREMKEKYDSYFDSTTDRTAPFIKETRKKSIIDLEKSDERIKERTARFSIHLASWIRPCSIRSMSVVSNGINFNVVSWLMPLNDSMIQQKFKLHGLNTGMVITKHALRRWLERNKSNDAKKGLEVLGKAILANEIEVSSATAFREKDVRGYHEVQFKTNDGGIAIIAFREEDDSIYGSFADMDMTLVTYISEDMVKNWNETKVNEYKDFLYYEDEKEESSRINSIINDLLS